MSQDFAKEPTKREGERYSWRNGSQEVLEQKTLSSGSAGIRHRFKKHVPIQYQNMFPPLPWGGRMAAATPVKG